MYATRLLGRLTLAQKFTILSIVALILACIPAYLYIIEADKNLDEALMESRGIRPLADLHKIVQLTQQHRGLAAIQLSGLDFARETRPAKQREIDAAYEAMSATIQNIPDQAIQGNWHAIRRDWAALRVQVSDGDLSVEQSYQAHVELIVRLLDENELLADYFGLSLDPDRDSYQLIQFMYYQLPYLTEETGQMRGKGAGMLAQKSIAIEDRVVMSAVVGRVHDRFALVIKAYDKAVAANPAFADVLANDLREMSGLVTAAIQVANDNIVKSGAAGYSPADYMAFFTRAIDSQFKIDDDASAVLQHLLAEKVSTLQRTRTFMLSAMLALIALAGLIQYAIAQSVSRSAKRVVLLAGALTMGVTEKLEAAEAIASGNLEHDVTLTNLPQIDPRTVADDEMGTLLKSIIRMSEVQRSLDAAFRTMTISLRSNREAERARDWLKTGLNELNGVMRGEHDITETATKVLNYLAERLEAGVGTLYLVDADTEELTLTAGYAMAHVTKVSERFRLGQGMVGQAAREQKIVHLFNVPDDYLPIGSGLGNAAPRHIIVVPLIYAESIVGVVELGSFRFFTALEKDFLEHAKEGIAIGFGVNQSRQRMHILLAQTEQQAEELRVQQEELQQSNEELEERADMLETQREQIRVKNDEVEAASREVRRNVEELERVSAYKSEFLANMSHELRTPLNSMLILSSLLQKNKEGQLTPKQVEYAATIHGAGKDLLNLISDILDLSKIEAGRLEFHVEDIAVEDIVSELTPLFRPLAENQCLLFTMEVADGTPPVLRADGQRTQQIVKNLLSNAFKFTAQGQISLRIHLPPPGTNPLSVPALAFAVSDSGIGIAIDQHEHIFHAFQQADGSTSRKYGGTGLGLSISRQLAHRMGGDIILKSEPDRGSVFTLYLPLDASRIVASTRPLAAGDTVDAASEWAYRNPQPLHTGEAASAIAADLLIAAVDDDRESVQAGGRSILIVEDDLAFAEILRDTVREHGFQAIVASDGESGLALAERYAPNAIILDVMLPHIDGWGVMRRIKDNPRTRHIPVHFLTCLDDRQKALNMGAIGFVAKPVNVEQLDDVFHAIGAAIDRSARKLLVVEDNVAQAESIAALLATRSLEIVIARTGYEALERLMQDKFDCMVLDLGLADMSGFDLLDALQRQDIGQRVPVIVHSGRNLSEVDERRLQGYTGSIIVKGAQSPERLLNEVSLFLHLVDSALPQEQRRMVRHALDCEAMLEQCTVLLVDDDIRNIFSLSSVLGEKGMHIFEASNGREALAELDSHADIDIVLMDIMMPEMDGYEAMHRIRQNPRFASLPIIAMTAKAMAGDQQLCLDAGANDYIAKPIDLDKLFSLMRVWLYQPGNSRI